MYEIKTGDVYTDFSNDKQMFDFSNYSAKSKYYDNSNKLVFAKIRDGPAGVAIEEFVESKPNMYSYLLDDNSEHKKAKVVNRNVVTTINHDEYKDVLLNEKFLRHSINRIQSKDNEIGTYEIKKISLSCFADKTYIQNNGYDGLKQWI